MLFASRRDMEDALTPIQKNMQDGKLGSLKVDPESLKVQQEEGKVTEQVVISSWSLLLSLCIKFPLSYNCSLHCRCSVRAQLYV